MCPPSAFLTISISIAPSVGFSSGFLSVPLIGQAIYQDILLVPSALEPSAGHLCICLRHAHSVRCPHFRMCPRSFYGTWSAQVLPSHLPLLPRLCYSPLTAFSNLTCPFPLTHLLLQNAECLSAELFVCLVSSRARVPSSVPNS